MSDDLRGHDKVLSADEVKTPYGDGTGDLKGGKIIIETGGEDPTVKIFWGDNGMVVTPPLLTLLMTPIGIMSSPLPVLTSCLISLPARSLASPMVPSTTTVDRLLTLPGLHGPVQPSPSPRPILYSTLRQSKVLHPLA